MMTSAELQAENISHVCKEMDRLRVAMEEKHQEKIKNNLHWLDV
jgi:hypothetical protein